MPTNGVGEWAQPQRSAFPSRTLTLLLRCLLFTRITVQSFAARPIIEMGFEEASASGDFSAGGPIEPQPARRGRGAMLALL